MRRSKHWSRSGNLKRDKNEWMGLCYNHLVAFRKRYTRMSGCGLNLRDFAVHSLAVYRSGLYEWCKHVNREDVSRIVLEIEVCFLDPFTRSPFIKAIQYKPSDIKIDYTTHPWVKAYKNRGGY